MMKCSIKIGDKRLKGISQKMGQDLPYCSGISQPQISAMMWCPHLLSNLSWFLISQHSLLQTGCSPGSPVWFYIQTLFIIQWFWILISPQSSSTDRLVQSPLLSFPVWRALFFSNCFFSWSYLVFLEMLHLWQRYRDSVFLKPPAL